MSQLENPSSPGIGEGYYEGHWFEPPSSSFGQTGNLPANPAYPQSPNENQARQTLQASRCKSPYSQIARSPPQDIKVRSLRKNGRPTLHEDSLTSSHGATQRPSKIKFTADQISYMESWFQRHSHPYPSSDEKKEIANQTRLTIPQVAQWFQNKRKRSKPPPNSTSTSSSVTFGRSEEPKGAHDIGKGIGIRSPNFKQGLRSREPSSASLENWRITPPQDEPAPHLKYTNLQDDHQPPQFQIYTGKTIINSAPGMTSPYTVIPPSENTPREVLNSREPQASSFGNDGDESFTTRISKQGKRIYTANHPPERQGEHQKFQCTYCYKGFSAPQSRNQHEKKNHGPRDQYVCMLGGPRAFDDHGRSKCAFCPCLNPSEDHLSTNHDIHACSHKDAGQRTSPRLDSFIRHMKSIHKAVVESAPLSWTQPVDSDIHDKNRRQYCGFCRKTLVSSRERQIHVNDHFARTDKVYDMTGWTPYKEGFSQSILPEHAATSNEYGFETNAFPDFDYSAA